MNDIPDETSRPARRATIKDVARHAGVSFKSVSRVINNEANVRPLLRERIEKAIEELGFVRNFGARGLGGKRHFVLGLLFDATKGQYLLEVQNAAMGYCRQVGHHLIVEAVLPATLADPALLARQLRSLSVDSVIVLPPLCDHAGLLDALDTQAVPYSRIAPTHTLDRSPAVVVDDRDATRVMVRHLWQLGHRDIAFVTGRGDHPVAHLRRSAFVDEMQDLSGKRIGELIVQGDFSTQSGMRAGNALLARDPRPTAVFASNDEMAAGVIAAAMERHLSLPDDLSVCGFDDSPTATLIWPSLTTVHQPLAEMTESAARQLLDPGSIKRLVKLDLELVVRKSTAAPSSSQVRTRRPFASRKALPDQTR